MKKQHNILEMENIGSKYNNQQLDNKSNSLKNDSTNLNAHNIFTVAISSARWKNFCSHKRKILTKNSDEIASHEESTLLADPNPNTKTHISQALEAKSKEPDDIIQQKVNLQYEQTCFLLLYVARTSANISHTSLNLSLIEELVNNGADINAYDVYGQTLFHEVARVWHVDVARCLVCLGANVNCKDNYGRTPLHVAAALDYWAMCKFLIENGADKEAKTKDEGHTPLYFAARNDATKSLKTLIDLKCQFDGIFDYKKRTPLYVAAELDRSEAARTLLEAGASAQVCDYNGQPVIIPLICKMAPIAKIALDQFHVKSRAKRRQTYDLYKLDPVEKSDIETKNWINVLDIIINQKQYDLIMHDVILKMIQIQWKNQTKWRAYGQVVFQLVYIISWSVFGVLDDWSERYRYALPEEWYRIVIFALAGILTFYQIIGEIVEYKNSWKEFENWKTWRKREIEQDRILCHPRWPEEEKYYASELSNLEKTSPSYFSDLWNIFDWLCYFMLMICIGTHIADIFAHSLLLARWHIRIMAVTVILLWLRLMKFMRAFALLGPFVVVLGHMILDVFRFLFLYLEFYIPFAFAFWMLFGGARNLAEAEYTSAFEVAENVTTITVSSFSYVNDMLFNMFSVTLGQDFDTANMLLIDHVMSQILIGSWLALTSVICLNIFIAILSNTYQNVYDNAVANSMMQKAIVMNSIYEDLSLNYKTKWFDYLREQCNPWEEDYDDDVTLDSNDLLQRATVEIRADVNELKANLEKYFNFNNENEETQQSDDDKKLLNESPSPRLNIENEFELLRNEVVSLRNNYNQSTKTICEDLEKMQSILKNIAITITDNTSKAENNQFSKNDHRLPTIMHVQPAIEVVEFQSASKPGILNNNQSNV